MVKYEKLGFNSQEEYLNCFYNTLLTTNHSFDYFVNWDKIYKKVEDHLIELSILNSLSKVDKEDVESEFIKIITSYPEVVSILPAILAIRINKKETTVDILEDDIKTYNFDKDKFIVEDIVYFCKKTGLLKLFNKINDLYAYLLGTEVGLDSNARKNRSGTIFENLLYKKLLKILENTDFDIKEQEYVEDINRSKVADFIISKDNKQILFIEGNFYNATGSKPIEVTNAYIELQKEVNNTDIVFLWVTDGLGWNKMKTTFKKGSEEIDYIINYSMMEETIKRLLEI